MARKIIKNDGSERGPMGISESELRKICNEKNFEFVKVCSELQGNGKRSSVIYIICNKHREKGVQRISSVGNLRKRKGCKYCRGYGKTIADIAEIAMKRNIEVIGEYTSVNKKIKCKCMIDGFEWAPVVSSLLNGSGCPKCRDVKLRNERIMSDDSFKEKVTKKYPYIRTTSPYNGAHNKMGFECLRCKNKWEMIPSDLFHSKIGCPKCSMKNLSERMTKSPDQFKNEVVSNNKNIELLENYVGSHTPILVRCKIHGIEWRADPDSLRYGHHGCPKCSKNRTENNLCDLLESWGYRVVRQKRFSDCKDKHTLPFDAYLPEYNICIEYDGEQHYMKEKFKWRDKTGCNESHFETIQLHDFIKTKYCLENKIPLIRIPYWEADDMESFLFDEMVHYVAIELTKVA